MSAPSNLIHDWNEADRPFRPGKRIELDDETLRDGLQSPSVRDPDLDRKVRILHLMEGLAIDTCDIGLPGAGGRAREHIEALVREMRDGRMRITPNVACRTLPSDIRPAAELAQRTGHPVEVCAFIGSSPIRRYAEGWDLETLLQHTRESIAFCRDEHLPCMFVTEDTTRADPETLRALYAAAVEEGAPRVCVSDTVGHATPEGTRAVLAFVRSVVGPSIRIDWHGHRDRGLGLANCLAAIEAGADRIHGTALGIGERAGNAEMDLLLVNLRLLGWIENDLRALPEYVRVVAEAVGVPIAHNYPVFGNDAFETATGVHAAAVVKALRKGDPWLANRVYSAVPADEFGLEQRISIGPMSGRSNVVHFLEKRGVEATDDRVKKILERAKATPRLLTETEVLALV